VKTQIDELWLPIDQAHRYSSLSRNHNLEVKLSAHSVDVIRGDCVVRLNLKHFLYVEDVITSFDYYFNAVRPTEVNRYKLVDYSAPGYHNVVGFDLMPVFFTSLCEPISTTTQYLEFANLKPGDTCFDLGAYSGLTSILFKQAVGSLGRVISVEADSENILSIRNNLDLFKKLTGLAVDVLFAAVWNHNDGLSFSSEGNMGSSASDIVGSKRGTNDFVKSFTLTELAKYANCERVDFIKCDIEGAENVVFEDELFLRSYFPRIIIETHDVGGIQTTDRCIFNLSKLGYDCKKVAQAGVSLPLLECRPPARIF